MKVLVLVGILAACVTAAAAAAASCAAAEDFFSRHNVSADESQEPGSVCGGHCCRRGGELKLRSMLQQTAEQRVSRATKPITELLLGTRRTLQEHLSALSHQSQNKTSVLFSQLYRSQATRAHAPLAALYDDVRVLIRPDKDTNLNSPPPRDMRISTKRFFRDVFPIAYQNVIRLDMKQFTPEYEACLRDAYDAVQPFGVVPEQLGASMSRSLEAARALLQVIAVGASALSSSEHILATADEECGNKLLKMGGCSRCKGHDSSPCRNYCLNVARGCIGSLVVELDAPWAGYVEGVERLARADADAELRGLDAKVSEAIMHALENHVILEKKVRQECGPPSTLDLKNMTSSKSSPGAIRRDALRAPPPDTELLQFAATLAASKKLFATLSDRLCDEPDFANEGNDRCWNGETIGEYTKALVASASMSDQKYNPEITKTLVQDARVSALGDRLRQARQLLVSHWGSVPAVESFMQGDEAGDEGSGSGRSYTDDDAAYDSEGSGEGSGSEFVGSRREDDETTYSSPPIPTSSSSASCASLMSVITVTSIFVFLT